MATSEKELIAFFGGVSKSIDIPTFDQILQMDDDQEREFSRTLVFEFLDQAEDTFGRIQESLDSKDLPDLSSKGHYLKGSSATLGLIKIRDHCEKIQRYGLKENVDGSPEPDEELNLKRIKETLKELRVDFDEISKAMKRFYKTGDEEEDETDERDERNEKDDKSEEPASAEEAEDTDDTEPLEDVKDTKKANGAKDGADVAKAAAKTGSKDAVEEATKEAGTT